MRLWSLHPRYLDARGLVALWREGLLAQKVLSGGAPGYSRHPQLERFRAHPHPESAISSYLQAVYHEASERGYGFDRGKIGRSASPASAMEVTDGQLRYELSHLSAKLESRAPAAFERLLGVCVPDPHPGFAVVPGPVASWERTAQ